MPGPESGKSYLIVWCKGCSKGFRVVKEPVLDGKQVEVRGPLELQCKGCGHRATYETREMRIAHLGPKQKRVSRTFGSS